MRKNESTLKGLNVNKDFVFNQIGKCYKRERSPMTSWPTKRERSPMTKWPTKRERLPLMKWPTERERSPTRVSAKYLLGINPQAES
jgi:hypothetical protein